MVDKVKDFSLWLDFIERDYLQSSFRKLIDQGIINGATSNPAIFAAALTTSPAYAKQLHKLKNHSAKAKYEALAKTDIALAADVLKPLYDEGKDGFVSIEVDPFLCDNSADTIKEGKRLYSEIDRENVMIKVPATNAGFEAMRQLTSDGIHVNATLIFSPDQAKRSLEAIKRGIEESRSKSDKNVQGVLSVFVSRFDRLLDKKVESAGLQPGRVGIVNAAKIYAMCEAADESAIRTLFASTGVKDNAYDSDYYIKKLMASHSVNTAPLVTIEAFMRHPSYSPELPIEADKIDDFFDKLAKSGINMQTVYDKLLEDGLQAFKNAFAKLLSHLEG